MALAIRYFCHDLSGKGKLLQSRGSPRPKTTAPGEHVPKVLDGPSSPVDPYRQAHGVQPFAYMGDVLEPVISGETKGNEPARWHGKIVNKVNGEHPMGIGIIPRN
jgi:hypothetical protein